MAESVNYLGGGGARPEKPSDYYGRIDQAKRGDNSHGANRANKVQSSTKVNPSKQTQKSTPATNVSSSSFDKILKKNIESQKSKGQRNEVQNTSNSFAKKMGGVIAKQTTGVQDTKAVGNQGVTNKLSSNNLRGSGREQETGTNLALKQLAIEYEEQIYGIIWNMIFTSGDREYPGGLGEEIFHKELIAEMQKYTNTGQMGPIAESIYNDMTRRAEQKNGKT